MSSPVPPLSACAATAPAHCPLCGQANACHMAAGQDAGDCWCMQTPVSPQALARVPVQERHQRCLCPACAQAAAPSA